jgi:hypothetical protein
MPAHALLPAVNRLLQQVEETSGLPVAVAQQSDLENLATLRPPPRSPSRPQPPQPRAGCLAIQNPMPQPPAAARRTTHPSARVGHQADSRSPCAG